MSKCIVCNSNAIERLYTGLLKCRDCGHSFADLLMTDKELFSFYNKKYFFGNEYSNYPADKEIIQKNFKSRLGVIRKYITSSRHHNVFEIGCAYGFFLDIARDVFDTVKGIDVTEDGIDFARKQLNLDVIQADFLEYHFGEQKFDVVCMWDTIEHLRSPHLFLNKIGTHMDRGGLLALTTGDMGSLIARIRKDKWRFIKPPEHLHYFSQKTLKKMLNNYGFDILYNRYCGNYLSFENIFYKLLVLNNRSPLLYNLMRKVRLNKLYLYLKLFDTMYVIARKR